MTSIFKPDVLKGKCALVTGGATGINYEIARHFLLHGAKVCIASRKLPNIEKAVDKLRQEAPKGEVYGRSCDVRKPQEVEELVRFCVDKMGGLNVLVNGAAGNFLAAFENLSLNAFRTVMEIDTFGSFIVAKAAYTIVMKEHGGVIINITASLHYNGTALQLHAGTAKAGVDALTKHLAVELGPKGVRVNGICPGPIDDTEGFTKLSAGKGDAIRKVIPLQRFGTKS